MNKDLLIDGREYISASRASKKVGYSQDYIGELVRAGKISGRMIGRTWFVDHLALIDHKKNNLTRVRVADGTTEPLKSRIPEIVSSAKVVETGKARDLLPKLDKTPETRFGAGLIEKAVVAAVSVIIIGYSGANWLEYFSPSTLTGFDMSIADATSANTLGSIFDTISGQKNLSASVSVLLTKNAEPANSNSLESILSGAPVPRKMLTLTSSTTDVSLSLSSLRSEIESSLKGYVEGQISAARLSSGTTTRVTYVSQSQVVDLSSFRASILSEVGTHSTHQSTNDVGNFSIGLSTLQNNGLFTNPSLTGGTITGATIAKATITEATSTSFFSTTASSTNLFAASASFGNLVSLSASSTNLFANKLSLTQAANGQNFFTAKRATDIAPSGDFITYTDASGNTPLFRVDNSGNIFAGGITNSGAFTITSVSTPQFRVQYDPSNENTLMVNSAGISTFAFNGTTPKAAFVPQANALDSFTFNDSTSVPVLTIDTIGKKIIYTNEIGTNATITNATTTNLFSTTASSTKLFTSSLTVSSTTLVTTSAGNVGIGTTSPLSSLEIATAFSSNKSSLLINQSDISSFGEDIVTSGLGLRIRASGTLTSGSQMLAVGTGTGTNTGNLLAVQFNGNVGIGTTSPLTKLSVQGTAGSNDILNIASSSGASFLYVNSAGNVGIGTPSPNALLDLASATQVSSRIRLSGQEYFAAGNTSTNGVDIRLGVNRTGERQIWFADSADAINSTTALIRMRLGKGTYASVDSLSTDGTTALPLALNSTGGNVGINDTNPASKLTVSGDIRIKAGSGGQLIFADGSTMASANTGSATAVSNITDAILTGDSDANGSGDVILKTASNDRLHILNNGNIGIGTTTPGSSDDGQVGTSAGSRLWVNVQGASGFGALSLQNAGTISDGTTAGVLQFSAPTETSGQRIKAQIAGLADGGTSGARGGAIIFNTKADSLGSLNERMRITSVGNIGIGTTTPGSSDDSQVGTNPASRLWVNIQGAAGFGALSLQNAGTISDGTTVGLVQFSAAGETSGQRIKAQIDGLADGGTSGARGGAITFNTKADNLSALNERMRITSAGNIGIGTITPNRGGYGVGNTVLTIESGTTDKAGVLELIGKDLTSNNAGGVISFKNNDAGTFRDMSTIYGANRDGANNSGYLSIWTMNAGTSGERFRIDHVGNVGIGVTNPSAKLEVNGTIKITAGSGGGLTFADGTTITSNAAAGAGIVSNTDVSLSADADANGSGIATFATHGSERLRIDNSGNVGVGTTVPGDILHVLKAQNAITNVQVQNTTSGAAAQAAFLAKSDTTNLFLGAHSSTFLTRPGIGFLDVQTNNDLGIFTNDTERLTVQAGGNIGIGTTSPLTKLSIQGTAGANDILNVASSTGTSLFYITSNGNVGIGTTTPGALRTGSNQLVIAGTGDTGLSIISGATNLGMISFGRTVGNNDGDSSNRGKIWYDQTKEMFRIQSAAGLVTGASGITERSGNVGIGTTTPIAGLQIVTSGALTPLKINGGSNSGVNVVEIGAGAISAPNLFVLSDNGYVGVGVTVPRAQISLNNQIGNGTDPQNYTATNGVNGQALLNSYFTSNTDGSGPFPRYLDIASIGAPDGTNGGGNIRFLTNPVTNSSPAVERMRISSNGNVGIGTTNPGALLEVNGITTFDGVSLVKQVTAGQSAQQIWASSAASNNNLFAQFYTDSPAQLRGSISYNNGGGVVAYNTTSDERLKNDLGVLLDTSVLNNIKIHKFTWKDTGNQTIGVFAQELYTVLPNAVTVGSDEVDQYGHLKNPWSVDYSKFVPDLVVGWQVHDKSITGLSIDLASATSSILALENFASTTSQRLDTLEHLMASTTAFTISTSTPGFLASVISTIENTVFARFKATEVHTDNLCVGDVCVTRDKFLQMAGYGTTPPSGGSSSGTSTPPDTATSTPDTTSTSTPPTTNDNASSTPEVIPPPSDASSTDAIASTNI